MAGKSSQHFAGSSCCLGAAGMGVSALTPPTCWVLPAGFKEHAGKTIPVFYKKVSASLVSGEWGRYGLRRGACFSGLHLWHDRSHLLS